MEFKTFSKDDEKLKPYLTGSFSNSKIALPVRPIQAKFMDLVTVKLVEAEKVKSKYTSKLILDMTRSELMGLSVFPLLIAFLYFQSLGATVSLLQVVLATLSLLCIHVSVFSLNDYFDHLKGGDRMSLSSGSQVIQKGWLRAKTVFKVSIVFMVLACVFSFPLILSKLPDLLILSLVVAASAIGFSVFGKGFKYLGVGEFFIFICFGPLIFYGVSLLVGTDFDLNAILMSSALAWMVVLYQQVKNFQNIYIDSHLNIGTFISRLGFDRSKKVLFAQCLIVVAISASLLVFLGSMAWAVTGVIFGSVFVLTFLNTLRKIDSPMSGFMKKLNRQALIIHYSFSFFMICFLLLRS